jgi:hypothetical protein
MAIQAMWIHGNTARTQETTDKLHDVPEREHSALLGYPQGHGITFRGRDGKSNWFHFCIPTPSFRDETPNQPGGHRWAQLRKVFVLFEAQRGVSLSAVHVWDGSRKMFAKGNLGLGGNHTEVDNTNQWLIQGADVKPEVRYGIGLSVEITFADVGEITFVSAGADFEV